MEKSQYDCSDVTNRAEGHANEVLSGFPRPYDSSSLAFSFLPSLRKLVLSRVKAARKIPKFGFDEKCADQLTRILISEFSPSSVLSRRIAVSPIGREGNST